MGASQTKVEEKGSKWLLRFKGGFLVGYSIPRKIIPIPKKSRGWRVLKNSSRILDPGDKNPLSPGMKIPNPRDKNPQIWKNHQSPKINIPEIKVPNPRNKNPQVLKIPNPRDKNPQR